MAATLTITHTPAGGTIVGGSGKHDGVYELLAGLRKQGQGNWRYHPEVGIYLRHSRDKTYSQVATRINLAKAELEARGFEVKVEYDDSRKRTVEEAERERREMSRARVGYHQEKAAKAHGEAGRRFEAEHRIRDGYPAGQPVLTDHYSAPRHLRELKRADNHFWAGIDADRRGTHHENRAQAAAAHMTHRESPVTTLNRIDRLETDRRRLERALNGTKVPTRYAGSQPAGPAAGARREKIESEIKDLDEKIAYWRAHIAALEADGLKIWTAADFRKGDYVSFGGPRWYQVLRVNKKSLTVPAGANLQELQVVTPETVRSAVDGSGWTGKVPYSEVTGRRPAEEMTAEAETTGESR